MESKFYLFTGLPCSGKTTLSKNIYKILSEKIGKENLIWFDGDSFREELKSRGIILGFSEEDRFKNINYLAEIAFEKLEKRKSVIASFVCPNKETRDILRNKLGKKFNLIFVNCPLEICEKRDVKGMYSKARKGEIKNFTGIDSTFNEPLNSDLILTTNTLSIEECVNKFLETFNFSE